MSCSNMIIKCSVVFLVAVFGSTQGEIPSCRGRWTRWFDRDDPSGRCDCESLADFKREAPYEICHNPIGLDARIKGSEIRYTHASNIVANTRDGFQCWNRDGYRCLDYEVRFCCREEAPSCPGYWSPWFDRDNPSGSCDCETRVDLLKSHPGQLCYEPLAVDARFKKSQIRYNKALVTQSNIIINPDVGFRCNNDRNTKCQDYEVRFCCARPKVPECPRGYHWTTWFDRDNPSGSCDCETKEDLVSERPAEACYNPASVDARVKSTNTPYDPTMPNIIISNSVGFRCNNQDGLPCADYEARFCCPPRPREPPCPNGHYWTSWYDRDDPTGNCDCETLKDLRKEQKHKICYRPTQVDVKIKGTGVRYDPSLPNVVKNNVVGFRCNNADGPDCVDYEARFCCQEAKVPRCNGNYWTQWFDRDNPTGTCDCETLDDLVEEHPGRVCYRPTAVDARIKGTLQRYDRSNPFHIASTSVGFRCNNHDGEPQCADFEARFCCPPPREPFCPGNYWTKWYDRDNPSGTCDCETLIDLRKENPHQICYKPFSLDARLKSSKQRYDQTLPNIIANTNIGFRCNKQDDAPKCSDYEVRFCCVPAELPRCQGRWTRWYDRDNPSGTCDCETLSDLRRENPHQICSSPSALDARLKGTEDRFDPYQPNISADTNDGFRCKNQDGFPKCRDYEVRFCC
ncbi:unnamed protein product [Clavelina lepadiformis]|uniref:WxxW domain-containing protein n=1 Tax=Clavelina lepadiformis TaxID=159417 RepID=A0ABP0F3Q6_CLALP